MECSEAGGHSVSSVASLAVKPQAMGRTLVSCLQAVLETAVQSHLLGSLFWDTRGSSSQKVLPGLLVPETP